MSDIKNNIAWHPGFVNAMKLELAYNEEVDVISVDDITISLVRKSFLSSLSYYGN